MENFEEYKYSLMLKHTPHLGPRTWKKLINHFKKAKNACENVDKWKELGIRYEVIENFKKKSWESEVEKEISLVEKAKCDALLLSSDDYPYLLREIEDPPIILYYKGDKSLLQKPCIAIVGSRKLTNYGTQVAHKIAKELSELNISVVSGFALGIDSIAHRAALLSFGSTIAVLGCGIDVNYPAKHHALKRDIIKKGLVISEFTPTTKPSSENFPIRNRIISGISLGVVIIQAAQKSGSLLTANYAVEQNRLVFAIPGPINNPMFYGNNSLIREGAILIRDTKDILEEIAPFITNKKSNYANLEKDIEKELYEELSHDSIEKKVLDIITKKGEAGIDEICDELDMDPKNVTSILIQMEVFGKIKKITSNLYSLAF